MDQFRQLRQAVRLSTQELCAENNGLEVADVRTGLVLADNVKRTCTRVLVGSSSMSRLCDVGWVINESCSSCLQCNVLFSKLRWQHHCRACGNLVCAECCSVGVLSGYPELGTQRVCTACKTEDGKEAELKSSVSWGRSLLPATHPGRTLMALPRPGFFLQATVASKNSSEKVLICVQHHPSIVDRELLLTSPPSEYSLPPSLSPNHPVSTTKQHPARSEPFQKADESTITPGTFRPFSTLMNSFSSNKSDILDQSEKPHPSAKATFVSAKNGTVSKTATDTVAQDTRDGRLAAHTHSNFRNYAQSVHRRTGSFDTLVAGEGSANKPYKRTQPTARGALAPVLPTPPGTPLVDQRVSPGAVDAASPAQPASGTSTATSTLTPPVTPLVYVAVQRSSTEDRDGYVSLLYNVLVSSAYFERGTVADQDMNITHPTSLHKIIQVVNKHFSATLNETEFLLLVTTSVDGFTAIDPSAAGARKIASTPPCTVAPEEVVVFVRADVAVRCDPSRLLWDSTQDPAGWLRLRAVTRQSSPTPAPSTAAVASSLTSQRSTSSKSTGESTPPLSAAPSPSPSQVLSSAKLSETDQNSTKSKTVATVTAAMLLLRTADMLSWTESNALKTQACKTPSVLVGYQIIMPYMHSPHAEHKAVADQACVYVVLSCYKSALFKTCYVVTNTTTQGEVQTVRLKRHKNKKGTSFRVVRLVA